MNGRTTPQVQALMAAHGPNGQAAVADVERVLGAMPGGARSIGR